MDNNVLSIIYRYLYDERHRKCLKQLKNMYGKSLNLRLVPTDELPLVVRYYTRESFHDDFTMYRTWKGRCTLSCDGITLYNRSFIPNWYYAQYIHVTNTDDEEYSCYSGDDLTNTDDEDELI